MHSLILIDNIGAHEDIIIIIQCRSVIREAAPH
jgi:hypothetical protein